MLARGRALGALVGRLPSAVAAVRGRGHLRGCGHGLRTRDLDAGGDGRTALLVSLRATIAFSASDAVLEEL